MEIFAIIWKYFCVLWKLYYIFAKIYELYHDFRFYYNTIPLLLFLSPINWGCIGIDSISELGAIFIINFPTALSFFKAIWEKRHL